MVGRCQEIVFFLHYLFPETDHELQVFAEENTNVIAVSAVVQFTTPTYGK